MFFSALDRLAAMQVSGRKENRFSASRRRRIIERGESRSAALEVVVEITDHRIVTIQRSWPNIGMYDVVPARSVVDKLSSLVVSQILSPEMLHERLEDFIHLHVKLAPHSTQMLCIEDAGCPV